MHRDAFRTPELLEAFTQGPVRRDSARYDGVLDAFPSYGTTQLLDEHIDHGALERRGHILDADARLEGGRSGRVLPLDVVANGGLDSGEAEVERVLAEQGAREPHRPGVAAPGCLRDGRPTGVAELQERGHLVEGLSGRVVRGVADASMGREAGARVERGMATGDDQRNRGEEVALDRRRTRPLRPEHGGVNVGLHMIDTDERRVPGEGQTFRRRDTDDKSPDETGTMRDRDHVHRRCARLRRDTGLRQCALEETCDDFGVGAARDLGHHATEALVQRHLGDDLVGQDLVAVSHDRHAGFIASGFYSEDDQCDPLALAEVLLSSGTRTGTGTGTGSRQYTCTVPSCRLTWGM